SQNMICHLTRIDKNHQRIKKMRNSIRNLITCKGGEGKQNFKVLKLIRITNTIQNCLPRERKING
ncbi:Unknown protein, partial [Striga hermonthica]